MGTLPVLLWRLVDDETGRRISYPLTTWDGVVSWAKHTSNLDTAPGEAHDARVEVSEDGGRHWRGTDVFPWDDVQCRYRTDRVGCTERCSTSTGLVES